MEIYKYLQWINFLTEWNPGIETPGHFTVWWLRLHQARTGVQISHFMVSVFLRVSLPDRQTDRDAKGMKLIRHGQDIGVPTHHVNALGIWVFSEVWGLGFCNWGLLSLSTGGRLRPMLLILLDLVAGTASKEGRIQKPPHRFIWSVQNRGTLSTSKYPSRKR